MLKPNEIAIDRAQLNKLLSDIKDLRQDNEVKNEEIKQLYQGTIKVFEALGMAENGEVKPALLQDGFKFSMLVSGAKDIFGLIIQSQFSKKAEEILTNKFSAFKTLLPVFLKYSEQFKNKN
jgi:hypothetical protein